MKEYEAVAEGWASGDADFKTANGNGLPIHWRRDYSQGVGLFGGGLGGLQYGSAYYFGRRLEQLLSGAHPLDIY